MWITRDTENVYLFGEIKADKGSTSIKVIHNRLM